MAATEILLRVQNYDLAATLDSGQTFRWQPQQESWTGILGEHWVQLTQTLLWKTGIGSGSFSRRISIWRRS